MSERWVKATIAGFPAWINMAHVGSITTGVGETELSIVGDGREYAVNTKEPPEHFLPPLTVAADQLNAFVRRLSNMEATETVAPDGAAVVREARRLMEELRDHDAKDWVIRTYSGMRAEK